MKLIYDIDKNCSNLRDLAIAMKPLHQRFGVDMSVGMSQMDVMEEGHIFNKSLFRRDPANKKNFIVRHWDDITFYPETMIGEECKRRFTEIVRPYTHDMSGLSSGMRRDVLIKVFEQLQRINPELLSQISDYDPARDGKLRRTEDKPRLLELASTIDLDLDHKNPEVRDLIVAGFYNSPSFRGKVRHDPDHKEFFADIADKEKRLILADSLYKQGVKDDVNFVMVIGDKRHLNETQKLLNDTDITGGYSRKGRSFVFFPEDFVASCKAIHQKLSALPRKGETLQKELDALGEALAKSTTQYDGRPSSDFCTMALHNRYRDWGISIQRNRS